LPVVAPVPGFGFVVAHEAAGGIEVRRVLDDGSAIELVPSLVAPGGRKPAVAAAPDGSILVAWVAADGSVRTAKLGCAP
jgi:hypothetical protein